MVVPIQWDEPFGIVFAEALACGTPVISCPRGSLPEIVRPGIDGFLIKSIEEGCEAVAKLGTHRPRRLPAPRRAGLSRPRSWSRATSISTSARVRRWRRDDERGVALVSGHFAPSNLVGAHRARLWSRYLPEFGWEPIVVTGDPARYEERPDPDLERLVAPGLRVIHAPTLPTRPIRLVGDIGVRAFWGCYRVLAGLAAQARDRLRAGDHPVEFPGAGRPAGPSPLRRAVRHRLPGSLGQPLARHRACRFSRAWGSYQLASMLEPWAVRGRSLITGMAPGYVAGMLERNPEVAETRRGRLHADGHRAGGLSSSCASSIARRSCSSRTTAAST